MILRGEDTLLLWPDLGIPGQALFAWETELLTPSMGESNKQRLHHIAKRLSLRERSCDETPQGP